MAPKNRFYTNTGTFATGQSRDENGHPIHYLGTTRLRNDPLTGKPIDPRTGQPIQADDGTSRTHTMAANEKPFNFPATQQQAAPSQQQPGQPQQQQTQQSPMVSASMTKEMVTAPNGLPATPISASNKLGYDPGSPNDPNMRPVKALMQPGPIGVETERTQNMAATPSNQSQTWDAKRQGFSLTKDGKEIGFTKVSDNSLLDNETGKAIVARYPNLAIKGHDDNKAFWQEYKSGDLTPAAAMAAADKIFTDKQTLVRNAAVRSAQTALPQMPLDANLQPVKAAEVPQTVSAPAGSMFGLSTPQVAPTPAPNQPTTIQNKPGGFALTTTQPKPMPQAPGVQTNLNGQTIGGGGTQIAQSGGLNLTSGGLTLSQTPPLSLPAPLTQPQPTQVAGQPPVDPVADAQRKADEEAKKRQNADSQFRISAQAPSFSF